MYVPFSTGYLNTALVVAFDICKSASDSSQYIEATLVTGKTVAWYFDDLQRCQDAFSALGREIMTSYGSPR